MDAAGAVVVAPAFESADAFSEGRAAVRVGGAWGYTDPSGRLAVPARYGLGGAVLPGPRARRQRRGRRAGLRVRRPGRRRGRADRAAPSLQLPRRPGTRPLPDRRSDPVRASDRRRQRVAGVPRPRRPAGVRRRRPGVVVRRGAGAVRALGAVPGRALGLPPARRLGGRPRHAGRGVRVQRRAGARRPGRPGRLCAPRRPTGVRRDVRDRAAVLRGPRGGPGRRAVGPTPTAPGPSSSRPSSTKPARSRAG